MSELGHFGNTAKSLSKNPVGILALFIVLIYGFASLVIIFGEGLQTDERKMILWFIFVFTGLVLATYFRLVTKHHEKFYSPNDFKDEEIFLKLTSAVKGTLKEDISSEVVRQINDRIGELERRYEYETYYLRMLSYKTQGQYETAILWANKLAELLPSSEVYTHKAFCLCCLGKVQEALESVEKSFELNKFGHAHNKASAHFNRACYKAKLNLGQSSVFDDLRAAIKINDKYIEQMQNDADLSTVNVQELVKEYTK